MSLLWTQAVSHESMAWDHKPETIVEHHAILPVKKAGFASYTGDAEWERELQEDREKNGHEEDESDFDDDLHNATRPEPTPEEAAHEEEHGELPDSFYDRHDEAYESALEKKKRDKAAENEPDRDDPKLMKFVDDHGTNTELWRKHGTYGDVDLSRGVHATQSHVSQGHIDRYLKNPGDKSEHQHIYGPGKSDYLADEAPMFVTHQGSLHVTDGHHRVAAAIQRGDKTMKGWHYDLDKDPALAKPQREEHGDETWTSPHEMDPEDREYFESMRND